MHPVRAPSEYLREANGEEKQEKEKKPREIRHRERIPKKVTHTSRSRCKQSAIQRPAKKKKKKKFEKRKENQPFRLAFLNAPQ